MPNHPVFAMLLFGVTLTVSMSVARAGAEGEEKLPRPPLLFYAANNAQVSAEARLKPTQGYTATAVVHFDEVAGGLVQVSAQIEGLEPGPHGFHIHEKGDCSSPDASSAGDHFSPQQHTHGAPTDSAKYRHAGDLGNVIADENGIVVLTDKTFDIELNGQNSIIGRAVILHEREDDLQTQPSGDAGNRVACGVITG
jgi:Cu-Zn family superoxide dismutase